MKSVVSPRCKVTHGHFLSKMSQPLIDRNPEISKNLENFCFIPPPSSVIQSLNGALTLPFESLTLKRIQGCKAWESHSCTCKEKSCLLKNVCALWRLTQCVCAWLSNFNIF